MNKILSILGLCMKAGLLSAGDASAENAIKNQNAKLVIVADDASANTKKKFYNSCEFYKVKMVYYGNKEELGKAVGKAERSVMAVCDDGFAKKLEGLLEA
jgi:Ribosomal protein HS6-type (S12/L30/L7a)